MRAPAHGRGRTFLSTQQRPASVSNHENKFSGLAWAERLPQAPPGGSAEETLARCEVSLRLAFFFRLPNRVWRFCSSMLGSKARAGALVGGGVGWYSVPVSESVKAPGPNLQKEWVAGISVTFSTPHPLGFWSSPFLGDCGWREGERQLESLQPFSKAARGGWGIRLD